jgi:hypothetical protein
MTSGDHLCSLTHGLEGQAATPRPHAYRGHHTNDLKRRTNKPANCPQARAQSPRLMSRHARSLHALCRAVLASPARMDRCRRMRLRRRTRARLAVHHSKMRHARSTWRASDAWDRPAWPIPRDADHHGAAQLMELLDAAARRRR